MLDIRTVITLTALSAVLMGVGMLVVARTYPAYIKGINWWAWACCGQAVGWIIQGASGPSSLVLSVIVGNTIVTFTQAMHYHALRSFMGKPRRVALPGIIVAATCLGLTFFSLHTPNLTVARGVILLSGALLTFLCGQVVIGDPRQSHPISYWLTGLGYLGCCFVLTVYFLSLFVARASQRGLFAGGLMQNTTYIVVYITVVILTFGFLMMCNHRLMVEMLRLATLDSLTELYNRRSIEDFAAREIAHARRTDSPFSLLLIDLDNFKAINDQYGHGTGDAVLQAFAREGRCHLRAHDILGRFGGEEFIVLLPHTSQDAALTTAERLRRAIEEMRVIHMETVVHVTISVGATTFTLADSTYDTLIARADTALYQAKKQGRNRVQVAEYSGATRHMSPALPGR